MQKITVVLAILLTVLVSGCARAPQKTLEDYIEEKDKAPTSVEGAYITTRYSWNEDLKVERTVGKEMVLLFRTNRGETGTVRLYLEKVNKEYYLNFIRIGDKNCYRKIGCLRDHVIGIAIDKKAGQLKSKSTEYHDKTFLITDEQIDIMFTNGAALVLFKFDFPQDGYLEVQVPAVYVQGFLKKVNEFHTKTK